MRIIAVIFIVGFLVSCDGDGDPRVPAAEDRDEPCRGLGCSYDGLTELGIKYRVDDGERSFSPAQIDGAYQYVSQCFGVWYDPELLVLTTRDMDNLGRYILPATGAPGIVQVAPLEDSPLMPFVLVHELIHHLLFVTTADADKYHVSGMFDICMPSLNGASTPVEISTH